MRKYVKENLDKNEDVLVDEKMGTSLFFWSCIILTLVSFTTIVIPLLLWFLYLECRSINYIVTTKRVIVVWGLFFVSTKELLLNKIESVSMEKDFVMGNHKIRFSGTGTNKICFNFLQHPEKIKKKIDAIFDNYGTKSENKNEDAFDKLEKLNSLKEKGIISEKEFTEKKKKLLDKI